MKIQSIVLTPFFKKINFIQKSYYQNPFLNQTFDSFSFSGKKSKEEIEKETKEIKSILKSTAKKGSTISIAEISKLTGLSDNVVRRRILSDEELSSLRKVTQSFNNDTFSKEEKELFENAIKEILEQADNNNSKITLRYLCQKIGISTRSISNIIANNPYYSELWEKVKTREKVSKKSQDDIKEEEERIKKVLLDAIKNKEKLTHTQISQLAQIKRGAINFRIQSNPELVELYEQIKNPSRRIIDRSHEEIKESIYTLLNNYSNQNKKISMEKIEELLDISNTLFYKLLDGDKELQNLWNKVKAKKRRKYSEKDIKDLDDYMHRFFLQKRQQSKKTTLNEVAQYFDVSISLVAQRINANPQLKYQWSKVKSGNTTKYDKDEQKEQTKRIVEILKEFNKLGEKITVDELSLMLGLAPNTIISRIKNNVTANILWKKVRSKSRNIYSEKQVQKQIKDIEDILLRAVLENKKISQGQIAKKANLNRSTVELRIKTNENLHVLWLQNLSTGK